MKRHFKKKTETKEIGDMLILGGLGLMIGAFIKNSPSLQGKLLPDFSRTKRGTMKKPFLLTLNIEHSRANSTSEILETVELGEFRSENEAREILETILEAAGFEEEVEEQN